MPELDDVTLLNALDPNAEPLRETAWILGREGGSIAEPRDPIVESYMRFLRSK